MPAQVTIPNRGSEQSSDKGERHERDGSGLAVAGVGRRAGSFVIDVGFAFVLFLAPWWLFGQAANLTGEDWYWVGWAIGFFFYISIPAVVLFWAFALLLAFFVPAALDDGRTIGNVVFGIAVADADGTHVPLGSLLRREWFRAWRLTLVVPGILDHVAAFNDGLRQTRHDRSASTIVVRAPRSPSPVARIGIGAIAATLPAMMPLLVTIALL